MTKLTALAVLSFILLLPYYAAADAVDDFLLTQMQRNHVPGLSVAIVRDGKIVKLKGYGIANLEWQQPVTPDTVFQIASSTKPFAGTALMLLVDQGKISPSDKVRKYIPDAPAEWEAMTIRHLATHSSGISGRVDAGDNASVQEYVKAAFKNPLDYKPGEKSAYGFADSVVLTYIIEKISGQNFVDFLNSSLIRPLGMTSTSFDFASVSGPVRFSDVIPKRAGIYSWENGKNQNYTFYYPVRGYAAGGMLSTASDIAKLATALDGGKLLSQQSIEQMWSRDKLADGTMNGFGVGWVVEEYNGRRTVGHSGGPALADILRFPDEKLTIIVLANGQRLFPYLAKGIAEIYFPPPVLPEAVAIADNDPELTKIVGKVLADGAADEVDASLFTEEAKKEFVGAFKRFGLPYFAQFGPMTSLKLVEHKETEDGITRRYRADYGKKAAVWTFQFDKQKKIKSLEPKTL